jgi:hypothetical protein
VTRVAVVAACAQCGADFVREPAPGRPRTRCYTCVPLRTPEQKARAAKRQRELRGYKPRKPKPKPKVKAPTEAEERRLEALRLELLFPCGCGRDYLTVPLEEAHRCPRPRGIVQPRAA